MSLNSISKKAKIGNNTRIGNFTVINDDVEIGNNVEIGTSVIVADGARIADGVKIHHGAAICVIPQNLKFHGEYSTTEIGEGTTVREFSMLNRGTATDGKTIIGKNCLLMAYSHIANNCIVGNNVILANCATLSRHVEIDDFVILGGFSSVNEFCKIGKHAFTSGGAEITEDIPPYILVGSIPPKYAGLNNIGLRRMGFTGESLTAIKEAYDVIYSSGYDVSDAIKKIKQEHVLTKEINEIISFIELSKRGIIKAIMN
jgi:UDP-N-acetylglucosamine acyltransferase